MVKTIQKYTPEMERLLIHPGEIDEQLDFQRLFGNTHPVEIEIGMGKGRFLLAESLCRPDTNFIGIEWSLKWLRVALYRLAKAPRPNCLLLCLNADMVVKLLIPPRSVTAYHVYFPDPWPKEKHQKRRLFNPRFIEKLAETLV
ncbi:MAG: tRNA (guanosine(46)-N7)-methyltransferase TrmB, partial [bacterium]|nr:tRNA (guanosine(46)-N7)-methyltransferase TrmB [bacterium]